MVARCLACVIAVWVALVDLQPAVSAPPTAKVERVIVVFKTHFDLGYTKLAREVLEQYRTTMIQRALDVCDAAHQLPPQQRFVWTLPGWPMQQILAGASPETQTRLRAAIADGRLVWHALPGSTHTESMDLEDLVRGLRYSTQLSQQFHQPLARDAKMTDVPSHVWLLPTLLRHARVDFLHIGCNSCSASPDLPRLFWWEGPDGSRLLTFYEASGYGSGLKPPADWPYKTWLALIHSGDNAGPPKPEEVRKLLDQAARELPGVEIRMGRLEDFAAAVRKEPTPIPVVRADMPDTWIHGIQSMPIETKVARHERPRLLALEWLNALLRAQSVAIAPAAPTVDAAYEQSFLYGEHTWGASSRYYSPRRYGPKWHAARANGDYAYSEESWREHGGYALKLRDLLEPALAAHLRALAGAVRVSGPRLVVFNPLPWPRNDVVSIAASNGTPQHWKDAATGRPAPSSQRDGVLELLAEGVPPLGYRTYVPAEQAARPAALVADASQRTLENERFRVVLDPAKGTIASLVDKRQGRELVDRESPYGFGQYLYEQFNDDDHQAYLKAYCKRQEGWTHQFGKIGMEPASKCSHCHASPNGFSLTIQRSDVSVSALLDRPTSKKPAHRVALCVTLTRGQPYVDLEWSVAGKGARPRAEAGWLVLPLAEKQPIYRLGRLGSTIDPAHDIRPGANHEVFCLSTGLTVTNAAHVGTGVCPIDAPLVSLGQEGLFRHTRAYTPRRPMVFVNLFNNTWGTNFQQWIEGSWSSRVRVWAVDGPGTERSLIAPGWEARSACLAALTNGPAGNLTPLDAGLTLSRRGVLVTALADTPAGLVLRLWEQAGQGGTLGVRLPGWMTASSAQPCDLRGTAEGGPIAVQDGRLELTVGAMAPASVVVRKRGKAEG